MPASATGETDDDTDIFVKTSTDEGQTWSDRIPVNDSVGAVNTSASQFHPRLAVDKNSGKVAVCWYDCRKDSGNSYTHFFAAVSQDGFATEKPRNFQLNPAQSYAPTHGPGGGSYKEYQGLTFHKGFFYPVWIDNSNSTADNPNGTLNKFDVYTAQVPF